MMGLSALHESHLPHAVNSNQKITGPLNKAGNMQNRMPPSLLAPTLTSTSLQKPYYLNRIRILDRKKREQLTDQSSHRTENQECH